MEEQRPRALRRVAIIEEPLKMITNANAEELDALARIIQPLCPLVAHSSVLA
jgi:hypothetical protein